MTNGITWQDKIALSGGKIIGYYIVDETNAKYRMVFFRDGIHPIEETATSEKAAKEWILSQFK